MAAKTCSNPLFEGGDKCESKKEFFIKRFERLCISDINSDCEFRVGRQKVVIKAHKLLLTTTSEVFYAMFNGNWKGETVVRVNDLEPEGFQRMKQFIYTGEVNFESVFQALWTFAAGRKYLIPQLDSECVKYIEDEINASNVLQVYEYSQKANFSEFDNKCREIIEEETFDVFDSTSFLSAEVKTVDWLLQFETMALESEIEVFKFFEKWALVEAERRKITNKRRIRSRFNRLKKHIRFLTMDPSGFASEVSQSTFLTGPEALAILLNIVDFGSKPYPDHLSLNRKARDFEEYSSNFE